MSHPSVLTNAETNDEHTKRLNAKHNKINYNVFIRINFVFIYSSAQSVQCSMVMGDGASRITRRTIWSNLSFE